MVDNAFTNHGWQCFYQPWLTVFLPTMVDNAFANNKLLIFCQPWLSVADVVFANHVLQWWLIELPFHKLFVDGLEKFCQTMLWEKSFAK